MSGIPRAVLDTDIIFSRVLHELFGRLAAEARLMDLLWSDELLDEARRVLVKRKPLTPGVADRWVGYLREAFPAGCVDLATAELVIDPATLTTDADDAHVCALLLAGEADMLLTFDRGYLGEALAVHGVHVLNPDAYLCTQLDAEPDMVLDALDAQRATWGDGERTMDELLNAFGRARAPDFARRVRDMLAA
jgi:predicted nucleic acid-binding protein